MDHKTNKKPASARTKRKKGGLSWEVRSERRGGMIAVIAIVGVAVALALYLLQVGGVFSLHTDQDAVESNTLRLNEIVAQNLSSLITEGGDVPDWVEITNTGSESVNLNHYALMLQSNIADMYSFPDYELKAGECLVVYCEGAEAAGSGSAFSAPFKLEASGGDALVLLNANGKAIDAVELPELGDDEAYRRASDGSWSVGTPTPGVNNAATVVLKQYSSVSVVQDQIILSEASSANTLYFADENGLCHDYVEIRNTGERDVNLQGWYLSDSSDKLKRWSFPEVVIPGGGYLTVHCSGENRRQDPAHLHTDFKLSSDGENVYLSRPDGHTVSMIEMPALQTDQACSLADGKWTVDLAPTPGAANTAEAAAQLNVAIFGDKNSALRINEIMASPTEQEFDWVEIYNGSAQTVNLSGYGLSDSPDKPRKWQFPEGTSIQPGQYLGVFLSGGQDASIAGFLNADFSLASMGGYTVTLSDPEGRVLDAAYVGRQYGGTAYGRMQGQNGFFFFETATPGTNNAGAGYRTRLDAPVASVSGGLFKSGDSFAVELSAPAGSRVYYTLDCTDPHQGATPYTGPIQVSGTTILRAIAYKDGCMPSFIDTQSYIYNVSNDSNVHVVSVVSDPKNLYGNDGIISNYAAEWEKQGHVEIFTADGVSMISQGCGLSLHGMDSRKLPVKTFNVIARSAYGSNRFEYPLFRDRDYESYHSFLLRPSGEDYQYSFMRDTVLSSLMADTSVMHQKYEPVIVYMNGEYYTLCYLRERINKYSVCQFEGWEGMEKEIDLVRGNVTALVGSNEHFENLLSWIKKNDTTTDAAYEYLDSQIDIQNYIEYMALQIFVGNTDTLNVRRYRNELADGKWRWVLFDLDWSFFNDTNSIKKWLTPGGTGPGNNTDNTLFIGCMKNPTFREQFLTYFGQQMATTFSTENVIAKFEAHYNRIKDVLPQYEDKYNISLNDGISRVIRYARTRPDKLLNTYFKECFKFSDAEMEKYFGEALDKIAEYAGKKAGE